MKLIINYFLSIHPFKFPQELFLDFSSMQRDLRIKAKIEPIKHERSNLRLNLLKNSLLILMSIFFIVINRFRDYFLAFRSKVISNCFLA